MQLELALRSIKPVQTNKPWKNTFLQIFLGTRHCAQLPHMVELLNSNLCPRILQQYTLIQTH